MSATSTLLAALFAAAAAALPAIASAGPPAPVRTVGYADLDLASAAGRARLDGRIEAAVRAVCGTAFPTDLRGRSEVLQCREETLAAVAADRRLGEVFVAQLAAPRGTGTR